MGSGQGWRNHEDVCVCACVRACVHVRACVRSCVRVRACVCARKARSEEKNEKTEIPVKEWTWLWSRFVAASEAARGTNRWYTNKTVKDTVASPYQHGSGLPIAAKKIETRPFCLRQLLTRMISSTSNLVTPLTNETHFKRINHLKSVYCVRKHWLELTPTAQTSMKPAFGKHNVNWKTQRKRKGYIR